MQNQNLLDAVPASESIRVALGRLANERRLLQRLLPIARQKEALLVLRRSAVDASAVKRHDDSGAASQPKEDEAD